MLRSLGLSAAAAGLLLLVPGTSSAGNYLVTSCHDPGGQPNAAAGWVPSTTAGGVTTNTCAASADGALSVALSEPMPQGNATANWRFDAPPGTRIVGVAAKRTTIGLGPSTEPQDVSYLMRTNDQLLENCAPSPTSSCVADFTGALNKQGLNGSFLEFRVLCTNAGATCTRPVGMTATHMWLALEDVLPPVVSKPHLIDDGELSGKLTVGYDAADVGGGLYRTLVKVDGKIAQTVALGSAPCADDNPADDDPYQFNVPVPCPASATGARVVVDSKALTPGAHGVEIAVEDAAGNQTSVFGPVEFPRPNVAVGGSSSVTAAAALTGRLKMWFVKAPRHGRSYSTPFGQRVVTRGVLRTRDGHGIQGARIDVYHLRNGKRRLLKTGLKSRAGGKLTLILPLNVDTRTIEFAYRALRPGPITSRARLRLTVLRHGRVFHRK